MTALPQSQPDKRQEEYERLVEEFVELQEVIVVRGLELFELEQALHGFECYYLGRVQHLHALLDALAVETLEIWLAHLRATAPADVAQHVSVLEEARAKATESAEAIPADPPEAFEPREPDADATRLYRQVARQVHPDLASSEAQATVRNSFMSELNVAYEHGDVERMQAVLDAWNAGAAAPDEDLGEALVRLGRQIARARGRLQEMEADLVSLREGELYELYLRACAENVAGRDVVEDIVQDLERQIFEARLDLANLREEVKS